MALIIIFSAIIILLLFLLNRKRIIEDAEIKRLADEEGRLDEQIKRKQDQLLDINADIDNTIQRANILKSTLERQKESEVAAYRQSIEQEEEEINEELEVLKYKLRARRCDYDSLIEPLALLEQNRQDKLFYTIQLTSEAKSDIMYLLQEVATKVNHKDVVSKLVWQEFLRLPVNETLKRIGATQGPGIYKITNIDTGKCYVGKSTNVKKRIEDHFKSVVGIQSVADQYIHHEIMKCGIDNWTIEQVCECEKEELSEKEKFYISFFNAQDYGYNLKAGG